MEKQKISVKKVLEYKDAVAYIEDLAKSFKSGSIVIESGEEHVVMKPSARVAIKVEAKAKDDKQKIAFELSWTEADRAELKISDKAPEAKPAAPAVVPEGGAPAERPEAKTPATKTPAMAPAKTEPKTVAKTEAKPVAKTEAKKSSPEKAEKKVQKAAAKTARKVAKKTAKQSSKKAPAKPAGK